MKIRVKLYNKGWICEYEEKYLFGFKSRWLPLTTYYVTNRPFYYKTKQEAIAGALREIEKNYIIHKS